MCCFAMARQGGVGVLHRNLPMEEQAQQVDTVKRSEAGMITNPVTCPPDATIADVERLCARYRISGVPVTDEAGVLVGIVSNRDTRFETDQGRPAREVMTPMPLITAPVDVSRPGPAARADHGQGLHQERAVPRLHQGHRRQARRRRGGRGR